MGKYMLKPPFNVSVGDRDDGPGKIYEVKKLKHPVILGDKKHKYIEVNTQHFMTKKFIKDNFTKGTYKSETPKRVLKTLMVICLYELSKYVTNEILIKLTANDAVDQAPMDYEISKWR
ncbi:transcriptional activator RinB [Staphylococcus shinii]|uniref:transcriptional activator RinB n=1 Tax=Staphylococcus shinii TaxID=2912228 RepID=UPI00057C0228